MLNEAGEQLSGRFREIEETALAIYTHPVLIEALSPGSQDPFERIRNRQEANSVINRFLYSKAFISSIVVYSARYDDLAYGEQDRIVPIRLMKDDEKARLSAADSIWIGSHPDPYVLYDPKPVITHLSKVYMHNGSVGGYLEINVMEKSISGIFQNDDRFGTRFIVDSGGRFISENPASDNEGSSDLQEKIAKTAWFDRVQQIQSEGYEKVELDGKPYLMLYSAPNHAQWRLFELIPSEQLYARVGTIRNWVFVIGLLGVLLSVPIAYDLSRRMTQPIQQLLRGFGRIQLGNFETVLKETNRIEEFRQLSIGFNRMNRQLRDLLERLEEEHRQKREAEFAALQSQINPHFLYNTLDMINWMAATKGVPEISELSTKLARLFRISLSKGRPFIRLSDELEHCMLYMDIQQARYRNKFVYRIEVDPALKPLYVPKLILQPFVENSLIHGFADANIARPEIVVRAETRNSSTLRIIVEDNGTGFSAKNANGATEARKDAANEGAPGADGNSGYGIVNVDRRIRLYFGDDYGVNVTDRDSGGVKVIIELPVVRTAQELERYAKTGGI